LAERPAKDPGWLDRVLTEYVRDLIWEHQVVEPWQLGDVVAIDNRAVAPGRLPVPGGPRRVVVAWS
jgi:hypothetical protein